MSVLLRGGVQARIHSTIFGVRSPLGASIRSTTGLDRLNTAKKFYSKNANLKRVRDRKVRLYIIWILSYPSFLKLFTREFLEIVTFIA